MSAVLKDRAVSRDQHFPKYVVTVTLALSLELFVGYMIQDNLTLNVLMLIRPLAGIRHGQMSHSENKKADPLMQLAFIADNDLPAIERDARFAQEQGFAGLEFNYWKQFEELTAETIGQMRAILDKHQIRASMLGLWGWNYLSPDADERSAALLQLDRGIEFARQLGADTLVTGTGDLRGEAIGRKTAEFARVMPPYLDRMAKAGIKPAFYGLHPASFLDSLSSCERLWEVAPQATLKLDPANWSAEGQDYLEILHRFGNKVGYLHIKETLRHNGRRITEPAAGLGDIAWPKVFALLHEHDYQGWLSLEPHGPIWAKSPLREKGLILGRRYINQFLL